MTRTNELTAAKAFLTEHCGGGEPVPVLAAVSGGLDSMCLLHLLAVWGPGAKPHRNRRPF